MEKNLKTELERLIDASEIVTFASIDQSGYPHPTPMLKLCNEGINKVWFSTGASTHKAANIRHNPKCGIMLNNGDGFATLIGEAKVVVDQATKDGLWQDWFTKYFSKGKNDPEYVILEFTTTHATVWLKGKDERVEVEL